MQITTIGAPIDFALPEQASRSRLLADQLRRALDAPFTIGPADSGEYVQFPIGLPDSLFDRLDHLARSHRLSHAELTTQLLRNAEVNAPFMVHDSSAEQILGNAAMLEPLRPVLRPLARGVFDALASGKVVFAESATGTGKSRLIAVLALERIRYGAVVISAPVGVFPNLLQEIHQLSPEHKPSILLGRQSFISAFRLGQWLADNDAPDLKAWMRANGRPIDPAMRSLDSMVGARLRWLMSDAQALAPADAPVESWALDEMDDETDPGELMYQQLRHAARADARIILCSHQMLAWDMRLSMQMANFNTTFPASITTLLVDEAHQLESAFSGTYATRLAMVFVRAHIQAASLVANRRREALDACAALEAAIVSEVRRQNRSRVGPLERFPGIAQATERLHGALSARGRVRKNASDATRAARAALSRIRGVLSPCLRGFGSVLPSIEQGNGNACVEFGAANLSFPLATLWKRCQSVALLSATLYLPSPTRPPCAAFSRYVLGVPKERAHFLPPVSPAWIRESVVLHHLGFRHAADDSDPWRDEVASACRTIHQAAKGGVLVLLTSHATARALHERLVEEFGPSLISHSESHGVAECARRFIEVRRRGGRPLWLGVGASWTGIDLTDKDVAPEDDLVLTDLYIPRLPFGCNRTMSHMRRAESNSSAVLLEAAILFRQGIGRLVRREGVPVRRLWLSDTRLVESKSTTALMHAVLRHYRIAPAITPTHLSA